MSSLSSMFLKSITANKSWHSPSAMSMTVPCFIYADACRPLIRWMQSSPRVERGQVHLLQGPLRLGGRGEAHRAEALGPPVRVIRHLGPLHTQTGGRKRIRQ